MLKSFSLHNFKSFRQATLYLQPLTVLIGANASGKSNALEGLQLLSWLAQGRRLADLLSALRDEELALRGALPQLCNSAAEGSTFELGCTVAGARSTLQLELELRPNGDGGPSLICESLRDDVSSSQLPLYHVVDPRPGEPGLTVEYNNFARGGKKPRITCTDQQAVFTQLATPARFGANHPKSQKVIPAATQAVHEALDRILVLDPSPRRMRGYSHQLERELRSDGANVSAVLFNLCARQGLQSEVLAFVQSLPEQRIKAIDFVKTPRDEVMVRLRETFGSEHRDCEAALLSDGTLRVLAVAAALLSVPEGSVVVIEEIDNGLHPSRAENLLQRITATAERRNLSVLLTTHNPALLDAVPTAALPHVTACYRDPEHGDSRLVRLQDLPRYPELMARGTLGHLVTEGILDRYLKTNDSEDDRQRRNLAWLEDLKQQTA